MISRDRLNLPESFRLPAFLYAQSGTPLVFSIDPNCETIQWSASIKVPERDRKQWVEYGSSGQALSDLKLEYSELKAEPLRNFVDQLTQENIRIWAPYEVPDLPRWHTDRVCILGDAAHAMSPAIGQGAAQAFEDVGLLARLLSSPAAVKKGYPKLFEHFERTRRKRVDMIRSRTDRAESGRGRTESSWKYWFKSRGIWASLQLFGKQGYVQGDVVIGYDVTTEGIEVS